MACAQDGRGYKRVRVVAQDQANPCTRTVAERNHGVDVTVQSLSREEDAAALLNARHLVVSQSFFALILVRNLIPRGAAPGATNFRG